MPNCAVKNCKSWNMKKDFDKNIKFFTFPKDPVISDLWTKACGKGKCINKNARICSLHFTDDQWRLQDRLLNIPMKKRILVPMAVPTILLPDQNSSEFVNNRSLMADKRLSKKLVNEALHEYEISYEQLDMIEPPIEIEDKNNKLIGIQTEIQLERARELKILDLETKLKLCEAELKKKNAELNKLNKLKNSLDNVLTKGQIRKLMNPKKKISWSLADISAAISFHSAGPRAYRHMYQKQFPLPAPSTLKQWASKISARQADLEKVVIFKN